MTKRNRFIIVGAGNIGLELMKLLSRDIEIVCIDKDGAAKDKIEKIRGEEVTFVAGDATSRLVLEEANVNSADCVILTMTTEKMTVETARVLRDHFVPKRVVAIGITPHGIRDLESFGVEVQNIFSVSAASIRNIFEQRTRTAHSIGLGKSEILEVEVHPNSRLANKPIQNLAPIKWRIGIVYRDGNIIIPEGDTVLRPRDRVIILGDPGILKTVAEILTFNFERFPLEYGSSAIAYISGNENERFFQEVEYVMSIFPLRKLYFILSDRIGEEYQEMLNRERFQDAVIQRTVLTPFNAVGKILQEHRGERFGMIMLSKDTHVAFGKKRSFVRGLSSFPPCPILLSRGSFPYEKLAIPAVADVDLDHVLDNAMEISTLLSNEVAALLVSPSRYTSSGEELKEFEEKKRMISEFGLMYKKSINTPVLEGNPIRASIEEAKEHDLLAVDIGSWKRQRWFFSLLNPDVVWNIIRGAPCSVLLLPPVEEAL